MQVEADGSNLRDGVVATRQPHKLEIVGSSPALATIFISGGAVEVKNWRISVEPAKVSPEIPAIPGPIDLKGYEAGHEAGTSCGMAYEAEEISGNSKVRP